MNKVIIKTILCIPAALLAVFVPLFLITLDEIGAFMSDMGDNPTPRSANPLAAVYPSIFVGLLMAWLIYSIYKGSYTALYLNIILLIMQCCVIALFYLNKMLSSWGLSLLVLIISALFIIVFARLTMIVINSDNN